MFFYFYFYFEASYIYLIALSLIDFNSTEIISGFVSFFSQDIFFLF